MTWDSSQTVVVIKLRRGGEPQPYTGGGVNSGIYVFPMYTVAGSEPQCIIMIELCVKSEEP